MSASIRQKLHSNKDIRIYVLYCVSFMTYGLTQTSLGPIIPYFSDITGRPQPEYSFLFLARSLGFVVGALMVRVLVKCLTFHQILMGCCAYLPVFLVPFSLFFYFEMQAFLMFGFSMAVSILQIMVNLCILESQKNAHVYFWMLICHGMFGIGGLISPILVDIFQTNVFIIIGLIYAAGTPFYCIFISPQYQNKLKKQSFQQNLLQKQNEEQVQKKKQELTVQQIHEQHQPISLKSQYYLYFLFMIYIGMDLGFGNWIPSYAVMAKIVPKQRAVDFSEAFWTTMTLFRFAASVLTWQAYKKMFLLESLLIGCVVTATFIINEGFTMFGCYFAALTFGMCFSPMFPLLLTLQTDYKLQMTPKQNSNCMLACSVGQGCLVMIMGYLMEWFMKNMLFYSMLGFSVVFLMVTLKLVDEYRKQSKFEHKQFQLQKFQLSKV